ncbi:uncharacterized protein [Montipora foliosa]|uniref:uncharacterized protein n=1 Tax=Montipora foliosa TaxID=591990 RepID=UPI0035F14F5E
MNKKGIDIMGISETHWTDQGKVQLAEGDIIIYSGKDDGNHRQGVGISMSKSAVGALMEWTPISERIIQVRYYSKYLKLTVIHVYAPKEDADEQDNDEFYTRLQDVIDGVNTHDMIIVTGDMNTKVGYENRDYERVMGKHGCKTWKMNKVDDKAIDDHVSTKELLERESMKPLSEEVKYRRWNMIGHILRKDRYNDFNIAMSWALEGKRRRARLKTTWQRTVEKERKEARWRSREETRMIAPDREQWKTFVKALYATRHEEDRKQATDTMHFKFEHST